MLSVKHHSVAYGQSTIIGDLNLEVGKNEIVAVVGRNGMGKTTLMKSLVGMTPTKGGEVSLDGSNISNLKSFQRVRAGIGFAADQIENGGFASTIGADNDPDFLGIEVERQVIHGLEAVE